jgi:hypothetical protein
MDFQLPFTIPSSPVKLTHDDPVFLTGSCFTEHIGMLLTEGKFNVLSNPHGILFNPISIASGLQTVLEKKVCTDADIFTLNGVWSSWDFHSAYSDTGMDGALKRMNESIANAHVALAEAKFLIVTVGSAYQYFLKAEYTEANQAHGVANCHKAPGKWFDKKLLTVSEMVIRWHQLIFLLKSFNPGLNIIFTVSPVRHYRDGLVENNRSKARLLEMVHELTDQHEHCHYFPAYELVMDVLRDYRFFEADMVHPNRQAVQYVWEQFGATYFSPDTLQLLKRIREITIAFHHKERFPGTAASDKFRQSVLEKIIVVNSEFPALNLKEELQFFSEK